MRVHLSVCQTMADSPKAGIPVRAELDSGQKRNRPERSNATVRASIACVPCRTRHTKCDGFMPHCTRCKEEGQKCHYVSSRRGIRDAKKRNMMRDEVQMADQDDTTESTPSPNLSDFHNPLHNQNRLLDLYYANFHVAHSWAPPKPILELFLKEKPNDVRFLEATIMYIASQYSMVDSSSLRERAFEMSCPYPLLHLVSRTASIAVCSYRPANLHNLVVFNPRHMSISKRDLSWLSHAVVRIGDYTSTGCCWA
jgi:hypothetical protein